MPAYDISDLFFQLVVACGYTSFDNMVANEKEII